MFTIYALIDPRDGIIRYIGQTKRPKARRATHRTPENMMFAPSLKDWLLGLKAAGIKVVMVTLDHAETLEETRLKESQWIIRGFKLGWPLFNGKIYTAGGEPTQEELKATANLIKLPRAAG